MEIGVRHPGRVAESGDTFSAWPERPNGAGHGLVRGAQPNCWQRLVVNDQHVGLRLHIRWDGGQTIHVLKLEPGRVVDFCALGLYVTLQPGWESCVTCRDIHRKGEACACVDTGHTDLDECQRMRDDFVGGDPCKGCGMNRCECVATLVAEYGLKEIRPGVYECQDGTQVTWQSMKVAVNPRNILDRHTPPNTKMIPADTEAAAKTQAEIAAYLGTLPDGTTTRREVITLDLDGATIAYPDGYSGTLKVRPREPCPDCTATPGWYVGLDERRPCPTCRGGE